MEQEEYLNDIAIEFNIKDKDIFLEELKKKNTYWYSKFTLPQKHKYYELKNMCLFYFTEIDTYSDDYQSFSLYVAMLLTDLKIKHYGIRIGEDDGDSETYGNMIDGYHNINLVFNLEISRDIVWREN